MRTSRTSPDTAGLIDPPAAPLEYAEDSVGNDRAAPTPEAPRRPLWALAARPIPADDGVYGSPLAASKTCGDIIGDWLPNRCRRTKYSGSG